jgi:hypothetical protein
MSELRQVTDDGPWSLSPAQLVVQDGQRLAMVALTYGGGHLPHGDLGRKRDQLLHPSHIERLTRA